MRELTAPEIKVIEHLKNLNNITISQVMKAEFPGSKYQLIEGRLDLFYPKEWDEASDIHEFHEEKLQQMRKFLEYTVVVFKLLIKEDYLLRIEVNNYDPADNFLTFYNHRVPEDQQVSGQTHSFKHTRTMIRLDDTTGMFMKSNSFTEYLKNQYVTPEEKRQQNNLNIAVAALVLSAFFGFADFIRNLAEGEEPLQMKLIIGLGTIVAMAAFANWFYNRRAS